MDSERIEKVKDFLKIASLVLAIFVVVGGGWFYFEYRVGLIVQTEVARFIDLPKGAIIAYAGPNTAVPKGWVICGQDGETPELTGRFLVGTSDLQKVGQGVGGVEHVHRVTIHSDPEYREYSKPILKRDPDDSLYVLTVRKVRPDHTGDPPARDLHVHFIDGETLSEQHLPPAMQILFLCKTAS